MNRPDALDHKVYTIADLRECASDALPRMFREYYNEGAMDMITLRENEEGYDRLKIRPRVLVKVANLDPSTTVFGQRVAFPLGFSPAAMHCMAHPDGELATSRAAAKTGIAMALSNYATTSLEDVAACGSGNPYVMQLSMVKDRSANAETLRRAEAAGYKAVFVTVDCVALGRRLNEFRNNFQLPEHLTFPNIAKTSQTNTFRAETDAMRYEDDVDWTEAVGWLRANTKMQIWLKGVYTGEDVELAIEHGVDGILVSNHGGRQLDTCAATIDSLEECVNAAAGRIPIHIDGGIRRGSDIFKAIALGAQHCWVGRVPIWGLAYNGQKGVELALNILKQEFEVTMALAGCRTISDIKKNHLARLGCDGKLHKL